ncbi:uncharacterized protein LOC141894176 [Acropora palmata]|uniref:uncharacterized protein LOC141894176 n=1 Tax=Acropora palmata TaxID=6131 RepID=UPI003DA1A01B
MNNGTNLVFDELLSSLFSSIGGIVHRGIVSSRSVHCGIPVYSRQGRFTDLRRKYFKRRILYYPNSSAGFNFMELCISLSGDIHPLPGPDTSSGRITVIRGKRRTRRIPDSGGHVSANCIQLTKNAQITVHKNQKKLLEINHLNAEFFKCRQHFIETKQLALERDFDILTISETWLNSSVSNSVVEIPGYQVYRLDRLGKAGTGVCAYVKSTLKVKVLKDLTEMSESGLHQLWIQVQNKKLRSLLVCVVYRPPEIGTACLENELLPKYIEALSRNKDIVVTGDLNCDLLSNNPRGEALLSFCAIVNATQLIHKATRVTESSRSLLDVILVSDPVLVKSSGVLEITINDHFLVHVVISLRPPKEAPTYIVTRSFRNYKADQFANDIAYIPWNTVNLIDESVDNSLDAFNDLLLACLDDHAPIKTVKMRHKPNPFITEDIRDLMKKAADDSAELARLHDLPTTPVYLGSTHCDELFDFKAITSEDVRKVIMAMPSNKAPGYDKIPVFVIKDCLSYILPALTALINSSFSNSVFPKAWKKSEVVPHRKDGDHETPRNNRPITLLPVLSKVTEKIALNQFTEYLTQQGNLTCHQSGNRKFHSTETLSLLVTGHIYKAMDKKEITAMVLIDLSKAIDSICHRTLLTKLKGLGASNEALNWFESYLTNRMQSTRLGASRSIE